MRRFPVARFHRWLLAAEILEMWPKPAKRCTEPGQLSLGPANDQFVALAFYLDLDLVAFEGESPRDSHGLAVAVAEQPGWPRASRKVRLWGIGGHVWRPQGDCCNRTQRADRCKHTCVYEKRGDGCSSGRAVIASSGQADSSSPKPRRASSAALMRCWRLAA